MRNIHCPSCETMVCEKLCKDFNVKHWYPLCKEYGYIEQCRNGNKIECYLIRREKNDK